MSLWRQVTRGLYVLTHRDTADQDVADEVDHYLEEAMAELVASGLSPDAARRAARLQLGNVTLVREQVRTYGWENVIETLLTDLRYGARRLRGSPGFGAVTVLTLALGIATSTVMFSAANPILFERLPYPDANRVMMIWDHGPDGSRQDVTFGTYRELVERTRAFVGMAVMRPSHPTLTGLAEPERLDGQRVTAGYFKVLGVAPALGRDFQTSDDRPDAPRIAILGDGLWRRRFGSDRSIVGQQVTLDDDRYTVIGVMPGTFENVLAPSAEVWRPLQYDLSLPSFQGREWGHHLRLVARLPPALGTDQAKPEVDRIAHTPVPEFSRPPWASLQHGLMVNPLQDDVTRAVKPALVAVLGAVILLLIIACVNVINLLLGRGAQRRGELAMRAALGATRTRLVRQLLTESLVLAALGGALGIVVAALGVPALVALSPTALPRASAIGVDGTVFAFALGITTMIGVVVGLIPALHTSRGNLQTSVPQGSRHTVGHHRTRRTLVVAEVALALMLLVSAGLLLRSSQQLFAVPAGFNASDVLAMQVQTSGRRFAEPSATHRFFAEALDEVRKVPSVTAAAFTSQLPLSGDYDAYGVHFESSPTPATDEDRGASRYAVSPAYFETMEIPLRRGRLLDDHDVAGRPWAAMINESFAKRRFPGRDPIGQRLRLGSPDSPWYTIVGIVGDVKQMSLAVSQVDAVYVPTTQWQFADRALWLVVRARGDAAVLAPAIRAAIWSVDKDQPIVRVATMDELVAASAAERRFALILFEAFGGDGAGARGFRHLRRARWQRHRANSRDRRARGTGRVAPQHSRAGRAPRNAAHRARRRHGADWIHRCPPRRRHAAVRDLSARLCHLSWRHCAPHGRVGNRLRGPRVACGVGRSVDHVASRIGSAGRPEHRRGTRA